ncbi:MAG: hypothetical protein K8S54_20600 [Spirochaetia bacterium]|nr:hypothetical protein [Spirochaetia bacterium]
MTKTQIIFFTLLSLLALQRVLELRVSKRNTANALRQGAQEIAPGQVPWMTALHTLWFIAMALEVFLGSQFNIYMFCAGLILLIGGQALRYHAITTLRERWSVRIIKWPAPPVTGGLYKWIKHPNYLGVCLEIIGVPLLHGAIFSAIAFTVLNAAFLLFRIRAEERAVYG